MSRATGGVLVTAGLVVLSAGVAAARARGHSWRAVVRRSALWGGPVAVAVLRMCG